MDGQFKISVQTDNSALTLVLIGELDMASVPVLRDAFDAAGDDHTTVVVDLTELTFIDSTGISELLRANRRLRPRGGIVLRSPTDLVRRVLEITAADHLIADTAPDPTTPPR